MMLRISLVWLLFVCGCSEDSLDYTEVKRIDEPVSADELKSILRIARQLPEERLPKLPPIFTPPSAWPPERTLSVKELVAEDLDTIRRRNDVEKVAESLGNNRRLDELLRQERMTREQFVGLYLTIGVAISRTAIADPPDFDELLRKGRTVLRSLQKDQTSFAAYSEEQQFFVLQQAKWLTRMDRAEKLSLVPSENLQLVEDHSDLLLKIFPMELQQDPLLAVINPSAELGTPFEDTAESGFDEKIRWSRENAILSSDAPLVSD